MKVVSLVVPVYFEEDCILQFISEVRASFKTIETNYQYEFVFVDDGSKDKTVELIKDQAKNDKQIKLIEFSF
jgi:dolichol-phosphate mannosyltransferase